jgi:DNA-binding response OmpR family regulator
MLRILLATTRPERFRSFAEALSSDPQVHMDQVGSGADAVSGVRTASPHLVIIDHELPDIKPLSLVTELLMVNAMVSTAMVSPLSEQEFHEAAEGLGILARLPLDPGRSDAVDLLQKLREVLGPTVQ